MFNTKLIENIKTIKIWGTLPSRKVSLCSDSRSYEKGELFWAIKGPSFDGFDFSEQIIEKGCEIIVFESSVLSAEKAQKLITKNPNICMVEVSDSVASLQELSRLRLADWREGKLVIGITGSNGKTTHKEILYGILENVFPGDVFCTAGNLNNHIGVPLTILSVSDEHKILIVEMGTNHPGEISFLCDIVKADTGLITNIGAAHLEFFKTEAFVFEEKRALFDSIKKRNVGYFVANLEDKFLKELNNYDKLKFFSSLTKTDFNYKLVDKTITLTLVSEDVVIKNENLFGDYNYRNLIACLLLAYLNFPDKKIEIINAAENIVLPSNNRSSWIEKNQKQIFLDAYNANPSSMHEALNAYAKKLDQDAVDKNLITIVVGDMNELGDLTESAHKELAQHIKKLGFMNVIFVGRYKEFFLQGIQTKLTYNSTEEIIASPPKELTESKYLFIKASRSLQLETLIDIV